MNRKHIFILMILFLTIIGFVCVAYSAPSPSWAPPKTFKGEIKPWAPPKAVPAAPQSWAPPKSYAKPAKTWNPPKNYPKPKQWNPPKSFKGTVPDKIIDKKTIETTQPIPEKPTVPSAGDPILDPNAGSEPKINGEDTSKDIEPMTPDEFNKYKKRRTFPRRMEQTPLSPERTPLYPDPTIAPPPPIYPSPTDTYYPEKDYDYDTDRKY